MQRISGTRQRNSKAGDFLFCASLLLESLRREIDPIVMPGSQQNPVRFGRASKMEALDSINPLSRQQKIRILN